jgi:hypothetical protein
VIETSTQLNRTTFSEYMKISSIDTGKTKKETKFQKEKIRKQANTVWYLRKYQKNLTKSLIITKESASKRLEVIQRYCELFYLAWLFN